MINIQITSTKQGSWIIPNLRERITRIVANKTKMDGVVEL